MKTIGSLLSIGLGLFVAINFVHAQDKLSQINVTLDSRSEMRSQLEALATVEPVAFASLPRSQRGMVPAIGFWSMQNPNQPPLPSNLLGLDVWPLGDGMFVLDDRKVDYAALAEAANDQLVAASSLKSGGTAMRMMMSSLSSTYAYGNPVYLTNLVVSSTSGMSAAFDIAGGTNNVPYDILMATNLLTPTNAWSWLGIGYPSTHYSFTNQPSDTAFYRLAKPLQTRTLAWGLDGNGQCDVPVGLTNIIMAAGGWDFSVALKADGGVLAWGDNSEGQTNVPATLTNGTVVVAGFDHALALKADGSPVIWGKWWNNANLVAPSVPSGLTNLTAISAGADHDIAVKADGTVAVWGYTNEIYNTVPSGLSGVKDVEAGWNHNVALLTNGTVFAWGANYGSFGWNVTNVPAGLSNVAAIAAGGYHTLALKTDGTVVAWGAGNVTNPAYSFLGIDQGQSIVPDGLSNVVAIAAGGYHSTALKKDGTVVMWGDMGLPGYQLNQIIGIGGGASHALALRAGRLTPPTIISQTPLPTNQVAPYQTNLTLSAVASAPGMTNGFPLSYQWQFNGTNISGANTTNITLFVDTPNLGNYSVIVTNAAGSMTSLVWSVSLTYAGSYIDVGTLAYHLSTNAAARTNCISGLGDIYNVTQPLANYTFGDLHADGLYRITNAVWSTNFWLKGVHGLSSTSIGFSNGLTGTTMITMISPRHYIKAYHTHYPTGLIAFLDTNNVMYWRNFNEQVAIGTNTADIQNKDIYVGILDADLPTSVGFVPILADNFTNYLPTNSYSYVQGIGMSQDIRIYSQPMTFGDPNYIDWTPSVSCPFGPSTNWNLEIKRGDSSNPEWLLIGNQLVLVSQITSYTFGSKDSVFIDQINQAMHYLSTNNGAATDYQITKFELTNWPSIH